jgi:hypothetical protein
MAEPRDATVRAWVAGLRSRSPHTARSYQEAVERFLAAVGKPVQELTVQDALAYVGGAGHLRTFQGQRRPPRQRRAFLPAPLPGPRHHADGSLGRPETAASGHHVDEPVGPKNSIRAGGGSCSDPLVLAMEATKHGPGNDAARSEPDDRPTVG